MTSPEEIWRSKTDEELSAAAVQLANFTVEGEQVIREELKRRGLDDPAPTVRSAEETQESTRWTWNGMRWIVALGVYGLSCAVGLFLDLTRNGSRGMGALLPGAVAIVFVIIGFLTDRSWSMGKRLLYTPLVLLLIWTGWPLAALFLVAKIGLATDLLPVTYERLFVYTDVVYQVSFAPLVVFALYRSRLSISRRSPEVQSLFE